MSKSESCSKFSRASKKLEPNSEGKQTAEEDTEDECDDMYGCVRKGEPTMDKLCEKLVKEGETVRKEICYITTYRKVPTICNLESSCMY